MTAVTAGGGSRRDAAGSAIQDRQQGAPDWTSRGPAEQGGRCVYQALVKHSATSVEETSLEDLVGGHGRYPEMNHKFLFTLLTTATVVVLAGFFLGKVFFPKKAGSEVVHAPMSEPLPEPPASLLAAESDLNRSAEREERIREIKDRLRERTESPPARSGEATIHFKDEQAYRRFLARAAEAGIRVLGKIDALHSVRVATDSGDGLASDILDHGAEYGEVAANYIMGAPVPSPAAEARAARTVVPLGNNLLSFLGADGDTSGWGRGVTIAVIDSGIQTDPTFGLGRLQYLDIGLGTGISPGESGGHGTAVAALAAGASPSAQGVAPSANLLGIRVTDQTGQSDVFTVSQAIVAAVDRGAQVINVSLGGYGTSDTLRNAITYAGEHGAVIVAAAGNDQAAQLIWPAADPRVVSVGAVDALGQQVIFSNSGPQLQITAPGYGVQTAWTDGGRRLMDGTSASAPIISGSIAAVMSANPGVSAPSAWNILQQYASEGGPAGSDSDYGNGIVNLGWAMARNEPGRIDTPFSSHYYDAESGAMEIVVQNRSGQAVSGLNLDVAVNGVDRRYPISWLSPGAVQVVQIPVAPAQIAAQGTIQFTTQLTNPSAMVDQVPANNRRLSSLRRPTSPDSAAPGASR